MTKCLCGNHECREAELEAGIDALRAHVERLSAAIDYYVLNGQTYIARDALLSTPKQSLLLHDANIIDGLIDSLPRIEGWFGDTVELVINPDDLEDHARKLRKEAEDA